MALCVVSLCAFYRLKRYSQRWVFGVLVYLSCFLGGCGWINVHLQEGSYAFPTHEAVYRITIQDPPQQRERTLLCRAVVTQVRDSSSLVALHQNVLFYLPKDTIAASLQVGAELLVYTRIALPTASGNPDEFDYTRFLVRRGISGTAFVSWGNWQLISPSSALTWRQQALTYRERILSLYRTLGFGGDEFAVLSALTVGYKEELSEEIRETYSISGASHVLALSGLHIGFLYAFILFCLRIFPRRWKGALLIRTLLTITLLWGFAFFTGLSPSVVRSVLMCSLLALSVLFNTPGISLNKLAVAALFMLLYQPCWLFDVGFQLSFCAVASILLIQPWLYRQLPKTTNLVGKYVGELLTVSVAAQIGTAPLVMLYFSRFSTHFLLTNLLVIPLVCLIMYTAVAMLLLTPIPWAQAGVAFVLNGLVGLLNALARWVERLPGASIDHIWLDRLEVVGFYLVLLLFAYYITSRHRSVLFAFLLCTLTLESYHVAVSLHNRPQKSIVFYNVRGCPAVHCIANDGRSWVAYADSTPDTARLKRVASNHWNRLRLPPPLPVTTNYMDNNLLLMNQILFFGGKKLCLLNDNRWRNKTTLTPLPIDYMYVCKGYDGRLAWLTELFAMKVVVLDTSIPDYQKEAFRTECHRLGIDLIDLAEEGSIRFLL